MNNEYVLFTDTACDLPANIISGYGIGLIGMKYTVDGADYGDGGEELPIHDFYDKMRAGSTPTTSQITPDDFTQVFEPVVKKGSDILYIAFSSGLSGTYNSACVAARLLEEKYPERRIVVFDSLCASMGQGLFVYKAACLKKDGKTLDEVVRCCIENRPHLCHMFTVEDLIYLYRGGRVSRTAQVAGSILGIKPVLNVDDEGHLIPIGKIRGRKQSLIDLVSEMEKRVDGWDNATVGISHGDCIEDAKFVRDLVSRKFKVKEFIINPIGTIIGSHSGPGTVALFFMGEHR